MGFMWTILLGLALFSCQSYSQKQTLFDVTKYGAKGDGKADDTPAFLNAWKDACSSSEKNPVLSIPQGKDFVLGPVEFAGPCSAPTVGVLAMGNVLSSTNQGDWKSCDDWISFRGITNLVVKGSGTFDGNGEKWWKNELSCGKRPTNVAFNSCTKLQVSGIQSKNSARNHFSVSHCDDAIITGINISAPEDSPNTDGMNIASSKNIHVMDSKIGSGDDCIAINNQCHSINISNVECGPGHGISVGSLGRDGELAEVEDIYVRNCTLTGTTNGARIKTWKGGRGYARRITFEDIHLVNVRRPIVINQNYVDQNRLNSAEESGVVISEVNFRHFRGTCVKMDAITLECSTKGPGCTDIHLQDVLITSETGEPIEATCLNAHGKVIGTGPRINCEK